MGGAKDMKSIANRDPINVKDLNRNRSPNKNPTRPDKINQNQFSIPASVGKIRPFLIKNVKILIKIKPRNRRMIFTARDPTFRLADSNANAEIVQNIAVSNAEISPK
jgi:hypothetical protein